jgi:hypothetical protein
MSSSRAGPGPVTDRGEVDDHRDVLLATSGPSPHVLIDANDSHAVEPGQAVDQEPHALSQNCVIRGVPGDTEALGYPRDDEVGDHDRFQCQPQPAPESFARGSAAMLVS